MRDNFHAGVNTTWYSVLFDHKLTSKLFSIENFSGARHSGKVLIIITILFLIIIIIIIIVVSLAVRIMFFFMVSLVVLHLLANNWATEMYCILETSKLRKI